MKAVALALNNDRTELANRIAIALTIGIELTNDQSVQKRQIVMTDYVVTVS